ncbi:putative transcription elongation factor, mitochondrial isoform X2 [Apostichopus japonicus]|uniref:Transcription elongation factor, mitochondrial n=1 Tax=Stichopus japonicus TaxID=307972 RepID=A0A2G8JGU4_STIJA|nr:putative transcription elongation factor, mitochondrial isoform X2 [Apostichopus japonicus]
MKVLLRALSSDGNSGGPTEDAEQDAELSPVEIDPQWNVHILTKEKDVVSAFNSLNHHQLRKYRHLSLRLSMAITEEREKWGPFKDLGDLLRVRGMGRRTLDRFLAEGLRPRGIRLEPLTRFSYAVTGNEQISKEKLQVFESVVTMDIGLKHLSWLHIDRGRNVRDWQVVEFGDIHPGKYDPVAYFKAMQRLVDEIPRPDLYILEHKSYDKTSKTSYHITLFIRTLESILFGMLNSSFADTGELECVSLSQQRVGKHFGLLVGTRRRSGQAIVKKMLQNFLDIDHDQKVLMQFRPEDFETFENANNFEKELLANSVLKAITFFDVMMDNKEF